MFSHLSCCLLVWFIAGVASTLATIFLRSCEYVHTIVPDSYDEFLTRIQGIFSSKLGGQFQLICTGNDISSGTPIHFDVTESSFKYLKRCSSIVLSVKLYLDVYAEEERKANALPEGVRIVYDTKCGFDAAFSVAVDQELEGYVLRYRKKHPRSAVLSSNYEKLLWHASNCKAYPCEEQKLLDCSAFAIIFRKPTAYSKIKLEEMLDRVRWPVPWNVRSAKDVIDSILNNKNSKISKASLKVIVEDSRAHVITGADEMLEFAVGYLTRFRNSVPASTQFLESTRRWIINGCLLAAMSPTASLFSDSLPIYLLSEYTYSLSESRIGSGPLDYYFFSPERSISAIAVDGRRGDLDEGDDGEEDGNEDGNVGIGERGSLEAKQCLDEAFLSNAMGQVCAQSLDLLKTIILPDTPLKKQRIEEDPRAIRRVKSILSTGHHFFFFTFTEYEGATIPLIDYFGKYSIDILPKLNLRESGLSVEDELDRPKIIVLLRALYFFLREDI
jgi:hypothetical protein